MYTLWNFFLTRSAFTILSMITLMAVGVYALFAMPKESNPEVIIATGIVTTILPGATAADVERLVTDELEPAIRNVANIDKVTSSSRQGVSMITAQFVATADVETSIQDLRNAVETAKRDLPSDAEAPTVTKIDFQDQPILMVSVGTDLAPETLTKLGDDLKDNLLSVDGVSKVNVIGTRAREVSVIVHKNALTQYNLSIGQVMGAISGANASAPAGTLTVDGVDYPMQFKGDITTVDEIREAPIKTQTGEITVADIATVIDGFEKTENISRVAVGGTDAQYALTLNIHKAAGENILAVSDAVRERLEELEGTLLRGSSAVITFDSAEEVRKSIHDLSKSGIETVLLVMLILFITIGFREAIVATLSIPLSFMFAFIGMWMTGNTVNFISLFALIIAIGILVDSGIVVVEGMHTNREAGMGKLEAARAAIKQFGWPLIAGTMTTVAVFVPLFSLSGVLGQFVKAIPFTIIAVLLASIIVALGFVPLIAMGLIKHGESDFAKYREKLWHTAEVWYRGSISKLFASKKLQRLFFLFLATTFIGAFALVGTGTLKTVLFPATDADLFFVEIELPEATTLKETDAATKRVEALLADTQYLDSYTTTIGATSAFSGSGSSANTKFANITLNLDKERPTSVTSGDLAAKLRAELAGYDFGSTKVSVMEAESGPPSSAPVLIKIWSDDTASLAVATEQLERTLEGIDGTRDVSSSLANDGTELQISVNRVRANEYGLATADIAATLRAAVAGIEATKVRINGDDVEVRVTFDLNPDFVNPEDTVVANADAIASIPMQTSRGVVALGSLITITADRTSAVISHENGMRIGTVQSFLTEGANAVEITNAAQTKVNELELPDGVRVTYGGDSEDIQKTFTEMIIALVSGIILMFGILVLEFNAFRTTLRLLAAIPLSLTGVLWGLFFMGQPLSFTAFLGIIALAGVIINHGILLLDVMNEFKREGTRNPADLILDAASSRLRPIILTTITTVIGMIPLTFVSTMWAPLAFTIAFGLMYGTLLTLVFIPLLSYRREVKVRARQA
ncbi:hypothetical protein A3C89_01050 [Candidatus Kaiserbacteria bacterium RIFCSPHIGHO2_02_FULL_50_50]|uniref:SSD domain-containing protein n=1 Tax=Candidatus Kaiserbacteria bacterium RIFCSPHIGHO2_02_FULL_50_50 TaxID=1798492 RepID=A0A1F6DDN6_9BACT|nr:MAG: hypothetical protein A3C89_01050 [Candidatus Kaiserbacteria bacterium RIFCSPHIGHO2_02_FULL_50_50]OGG88363.1 MAG: hypothetical protein A3G62_02495 [Candidatus Kaiserbacteria bacterium RIFCSPLOWO2_12_FULL_50_10]